MKLSEIEVGREYAYQDGHYDPPRKALVLEVGVPRKVWRQWGHSESARRDAVRVMMPSWNSKEPVEQVVAARKILRPWEEQERINERKEEAARLQRQKERETKVYQDTLVAILEELGLPVGGYGEPIRRKDLHHFVVTNDGMKLLLDLIVKGGS